LIWLVIFRVKPLAASLIRLPVKCYLIGSHDLPAIPKIFSLKWLWIWRIKWR